MSTGSQKSATSCMSSSQGSSQQPSRSSFSVFDDGACGEPLVAQHLVLDFTPGELDNDYIQRKCCSFWEFINNQPEIQNLMVFPEKNYYESVPDTTDTEIISSEVQAKPIKKEKTAVSMLEFVEGKGLINRVFEAKLPQSQCTLGSREYRETDRIYDMRKILASKKDDSTIRSYPKVCKSCTEKAETTVPKIEVTALNKTLKEWDNQHPKCMDPPGHPPALSHSIMQRKVL